MNSTAGLEYIRSYYSVPAYIGAKVYDEIGHYLGTIVGTIGLYIVVSNDDNTRKYYHPTTVQYSI